MLSGRTVLVTGASQGVGRGIALAAGAAGASVVVTARNLQVAESVAAEIRERGSPAIAFRCDVVSRPEVDAAVKAAVHTFGKLYALVHNATSRFSGRPCPLEDVTDEDWDDQIKVGLRGTLHCGQAALPELRKNAGTLIVLVSNAGIEGSLPLPTYSATKGAQRTLVRSLAREWGPLGVRVNALAPVAMTPAMGEFFEAWPQMRDYIEIRAALRRIGDSEADIGHAVNFLIGDDSAFITGQTLVVNGGALML